MATEIAKAYVQIVPSTKGVKEKLSEEMGSAGDAGGKSAGLGIANSIKGVLAAAGIGLAIKSALTEGADYEQLTGGVEKIFKDSSQAVIENAKAAYTTAGISANEYMEQVTSFSASLLQSVGGDTAEAANIADIAIRDMADNANVYGSSMESIQNAYQGFAKQNYTMLDNLKLGYGGTKTEMERLLADAEALTGVHYDIENLDDVYMAIHAIQQETGISGTTAKEAAETFSGSFSSVKASLTNVFTSLATGEGLTESLNNLFGTTQTFLVGNFLPMIGSVLTQIPGALAQVLTGMSELIPPLFYEVVKQIMGIFKSIGNNTGEIIDGALSLINALVNAILFSFPLLIKSGVSMVQGILQGIIEKLPDIVNTIVTVLTEGIPMIIDGGLQLLLALIDAIPIFIPMIVAELPTIVTSIVTGLLAAQTSLLQGAIELFKALIKAIPIIVTELVKATPAIVQAIAQTIVGQVSLVANAAKIIGTAILDGIKAFVSLIGSIGGNLVTGLWNGINDKVSWIKQKIQGFGNAVMSAIKGIFGIKSPSRKMRDEVGKNIAIGMANGITENLSFVEDAMDELSGVGNLDKTFKSEISTTGKPTQRPGTITINVYGTDGMDEETLAEKVMRKLSNAYQQEEEAYA